MKGGIKMFGLIPWRERKELDTFRKEMDRMFERFFGWLPFERETQELTWYPSVDISETPTDLIVKAEVPGIDPKELEVSICGDTLTIKGERKKEEEHKEENYHRIERSYGAFTRTLKLPAEVDQEKVEAVYKDGVLKLTLPKVKPEAAKKIEIKTA